MKIITNVCLYHFLLSKQKCGQFIKQKQSLESFLLQVIKLLIFEHRVKVIKQHKIPTKQFIKDGNLLIFSALNNRNVGHC